jgi:hypothetical protein
MTMMTTQTHTYTPTLTRGTFPPRLVLHFRRLIIIVVFKRDVLQYIVARITTHVAPVFGSIIIVTYWWVCVCVHA